MRPLVAPTEHVVFLDSIQISVVCPTLSSMHTLTRSKSAPLSNIRFTFPRLAALKSASYQSGVAACCRCWVLCTGRIAMHSRPLATQLLPRTRRRMPLLLLHPLPSQTSHPTVPE